MPHTTFEPRRQTFELLEHSRNAAAIPALAAGLVSAAADVRHRSVKILLGRPELPARRLLVIEWARLDEAAHELLTKSKNEVQSACVDVLNKGTLAEQEAAIAAICDMDMTAVLGNLINLSLQEQNPIQKAALAAVALLCDRWGQRARKSKDIPSVRGPMIDAMHRAIENFSDHNNTALIQAWLTLVSWEDAAQRSLIGDPMHRAFRPVLERLRHSEHKSVLELLVGYIGRSSTPKSILSIICERPERDLLAMIAATADEPTMVAILRRMRELPPVAALIDLPIEIGTREPHVHRRLWLMLAANSPSIDVVLSGAITFYQSGTSEGIQTAGEMIRSCRRVGVETLIQYMQTADANPADMHCAGAHLNTILNWIDGSSPALDTVIREFFSGFTVTLLLDAARKWPAPLCRALARVVSRAEPDAINQLLKALDSPSPQRRMLTLQIIQMLDATSEINQRLLPLIDDPRVEVRVRTINLLSALEAPELADLLPSLLDDPTTDVQEAASRALRRGQRKRRSIPSKVDSNSKLTSTLASSL